jgi:2-polyprenyl-3-methyl-5-hydroxy-6-metoxy-1,4-benzoquinol methylase
MENFRYQPEVFNQESYDFAKAASLTAEEGFSHDQRWQLETDWFKSVITKALPAGSYLTMDFGCGVGRMSKVMAELGHDVLGVDISPHMRIHASVQVTQKFSAVSPEGLDKFLQNGLRFDLALATWVLQHCPNLEIDIQRIASALRPGGVLIVADLNHRAIPTDRGWVHDGKNVFTELLKNFELIQKIPYSFTGAPESLRNGAWLGLFRKRLS